MLKIGNKKIYSVGEKIKYYTNILNDKNSTFRDKTSASKKIAELNKIKTEMKQGDVYVADDKYFGNPISKPRAVVIAKDKNSHTIVLPAYKDNKFLPLSLFDKQRILSFNNNKTISKDNLYEVRDFNFIDAHLTPNEKQRLANKTNLYIK